MSKRLLGANLIRVIHSDDTVALINKFEINGFLKYLSESDFIDNANYCNNIDFKEGKKQIIRIEIERDSNFVGCIGETTVYDFNDKNGVYLY